MEKISIIVPVYNTEKYLKRCIDSLVNQTYKNLEILLIDDGSKDRSGKICDEYANRDKRIKVFHQNNKGVSAARNDGIKFSHGNFIVFVDSDDWIELNYCEEMLTQQKKYNADIVFSSYFQNYETRENLKYIINSNEDIIEYSKNNIDSYLFKRLIGLSDDDLAHPEQADSLGPVCMKLYRKEIIKDIYFDNLKKIGSSEDTLFNINTFYKATKIVYINKCLYHYWKLNDKSITKSHDSSLYQKWNVLFDKIEGFLKKNNIYNKYEQAFNNRIALSVIGLGMTIAGQTKKYKEKIKNINIILNDKRIHNSLINLETKYFDLKWKLFFFFARQRMPLCLSLLLTFMNWFTRRK